MVTPPNKTYFEKIILRLNIASGKLGLKPIYIGNLGGEGLLNQFSCTEYLEEFGFGDDRLKENNFNSIIIVGQLNLIQADLLRHIIDIGKHQIERIIYIRGPISKALADKSYYIFDAIEDTFKPDVIYKKFPIDFKELSILIKEKQQESLYG